MADLDNNGSLDIIISQSTGNTYVLTNGVATECTATPDAITVEFTTLTGSDLESVTSPAVPTLTVSGGVLTSTGTIQVALSGSYTATTPDDFTFTDPTTITLPPGTYDGSTPITIPGFTIIDDTDDESDETIGFTLQSPSNVTIDDADGDNITEDTYVYTILDDDVTSGSSSSSSSATTIVILRDDTEGGDNDRAGGGGNGRGPNRRSPQSSDLSLIHI